MVKYVCIKCSKTVKKEYVRKRVRCPYCGSKILYKPKIVQTDVEAI